MKTLLPPLLPRLPFAAAYLEKGGEMKRYAACSANLTFTLDSASPPRAS